MRLSERSYPHPVLGNRDDVPGAAFQATLEMSSDRQFAYIEVNISCSCKVINSLLAAGDAAFVMHVECSNTLYRQAFEFHEYSRRVSIPCDNLNDAVEVNVFIHAAKTITGYRVLEAHPDYGETAFDVLHGDILAIAEGQIFHIESSFDSLKRIGSIMQINESPKEGDHPMEASFEGDKIVIYLCKADFADYKLLKRQEGLLSPLTTTIVLPILLEAITIWREESLGAEDGRRWVRALTHRIDTLGLAAESQALTLAQKLLELPVKRALSSYRMLAEATG
jgi:hypothetical protein